MSQARAYRTSRRLHPAAGVSTGNGSATLQFVRPALTISDVTLNEGNSGTTAFALRLTLSAASDHSVSVDYANQR